jgi:hypothetical protein
MGQEECTEEFKNTHKISVENPEKKRHLGRPKPRRNVKNNVTNWT